MSICYINIILQNVKFDYITVELPHSISILLGFCTKLH